MYVATTNDLPGFRVTRHIGLVRGVTVRSRNAISDAMSLSFSVPREATAVAQPAAAGSTLDWYAPRSNIIATTGETNTAKNSGTTAMIEAFLAAE